MPKGVMVSQLVLPRGGLLWFSMYLMLNVKWHTDLKLGEISGGGGENSRGSYTTAGN